MWTFSAAVVDAQGPIGGVVVDQVGNVTYRAIRDAGAQRNNQPMFVSDIQSPDEAFVGFGGDRHQLWSATNSGFLGVCRWGYVWLQLEALTDSWISAHGMHLGTI